MFNKAEVYDSRNVRPERADLQIILLIYNFFQSNTSSLRLSYQL